MLKFNPESEEELSNMPTPGTYNFEVCGAESAVSKTSGKDMIKLNVALLDQAGNRQWHVWDYLMAAAMWKLRHFCAATGLMANYEAGTLTPEACRGRTGKCKVAIEKQDGYDPAPKIKDYVAREDGIAAAPKAAKPAAPTKPATTTEDDDVPFK